MKCDIYRCCPFSAYFLVIHPKKNRTYNSKSPKIEDKGNNKKKSKSQNYKMKILKNRENLNPKSLYEIESMKKFKDKQKKNKFKLVKNNYLTICIFMTYLTMKGKNNGYN